MKKYSLYIAFALAFASCNVKVSTDENAHDAATEQTANTETVTASAKIKDPVCGMEMEGEHWTEMSVNGSDTTWFCSPHCKEQYTKSPEKYQKPAAPKS